MMGASDRMLKTHSRQARGGLEFKELGGKGGVKLAKLSECGVKKDRGGAR